MGAGFIQCWYEISFWAEGGNISKCWIRGPDALVRPAGRHKNLAGHAGPTRE